MTDDLNSILARYEEAAARTGGAAVREWTERYPKLADEIAEYALDSHILERGRELSPDPEAEALFLERARQVRERMLRDELGSLRNLAESARLLGLKPADAARRIGIGLALFIKLDRRLVRASGIPVALVERIAAELGRQVSDVAAYLRQPAALSAAASYKSAEAPRVTEQEDFAAALESCPGMPEQERAVWRAALDRPLGEILGP
jgi:hypothetical protein